MMSVLLPSLNSSSSSSRRAARHATLCGARPAFGFAAVALSLVLLVTLSFAPTTSAGSGKQHLTWTSGNAAPPQHVPFDDSRPPAFSFPHLKGPVHDPVSALSGLVSRVLGAKYLPRFQFVVISGDKDTYVLSTSNNVLTVKGTNAVSMATGLYWYLRNYCKTQITWGVNDTGNMVNIPDKFPELSSAVNQTARVPYRYYMNVCTVSYSMAWWNWTRWEKEIDWMALHGINLPLAFTGQEYVWYKFYSSIGLTDEEIQEYFAGPAFLAWQRMGNIKRFAGPLDEDWMDMQRDLQVQILRRSREFGMTTALPGFSGHVPSAITRIYPNASVTTTRGWANFNATYSQVTLLEPTDPLFKLLGAQYYFMLTEEFGTDHVYQSDTYNEMEPSSTDLGFLRASNQAVYEAMAAVDPDAVYLMQGWLFLESFWTSPRVEAYLSGVPNDHMMILDLYTEERPLWSKFDNYFGKPWIWNMLHTFGGRRGLYGNLTLISTQPLIDLVSPNSTMVGTGLTPEAIENNPIMYEMMMEIAWHATAPNLPDWVSTYAASRYGVHEPLTQQAWTLLLQHVYSNPNIDTLTIQQYPSISQAGRGNANATAEVAVWRLLNEALVNKTVPLSGPFSYDLVDVGRQVLINFWEDYRRMAVYHIDEYNKDVSGGKQHGEIALDLVETMLGIMADLDRLLGCDYNYLLGVWLSMSSQWIGVGSNAKEEAANRNYNARNQLTLWGPDGEINDYAAKHWNGLVGDYYVGRWTLAYDQLKSCFVKRTPMSLDAAEPTIIAFEKAFSTSNKTYPSAPINELRHISPELLKRYAEKDGKYDYTVIPSYDVPAVASNIIQAWTNDIDQLETLCNADPTCLGFNQNGYLKNTLSGGVTNPASTFYKKIT